MAIVTLLTDSGTSDHYVAAIKAKILGINPGLTLVDISHQIAACDIAHGAFVLRSVFRDFPVGTVHLVGVDATGNRDDLFIALQMEDHFFVGVDNGLLGLISEKTPQQVVQLNSVNPIKTTFPEKDVFAPAAAKLASNVAITTLGKPLTTFKKMTDRHVKANKRLIAGHVIRVDHFGNLITNIPKEAFDVLSAGKMFTVQFGGEKFRRIHKSYFDAEPGDCVLIFNSMGFLEIGMYKGNASELLGLKYDSPVNILFDEN
ncbi:MAG: S-adenosyl-l-methionine hydroxide adenosyltransferase family protein [Bacteroidota bacterium]|jgi:S-adenosylmethionine hydrolase|nr:SAM-dependent chlorinase/fluorinase [Cytophagales bacterium]MCE2958812.1 SAM-dependent chlorinase/fluorinase [Flammeovirgaceae bacterium]MCZ8069768.1 SAM-dependent chlorinase/fluorinase [Cytophagales bacterium]